MKKVYNTKNFLMNQNKRLVLSALTKIFVTPLILAFFGLQFLEASHVHSDGVDHSDCPVCMHGGILQAAHVEHIQEKIPILCDQEIFPEINLFSCIYFRGFFYTPCGPPQA